jgi:glycosyltransferase involved in cell wall biosynthesis
MTASYTDRLNDHTHPQVSVVMTVFNGERHLRPAIESVLRQTFHDLELIVVDDGSSDGSLDIVRSCDDPRLRLVAQSNHGHAAALNAGVRLCRGEYVAVMDHDDVSYPERIETELTFLKDHPDHGLVGSQYESIDSNGEVLGIHRVPVEHDEICRILRTEGDCIAGPSMMLRRDALLEVGGYRSEFDLAQDYDLALRVADKWRLANLPSFLLQWRFDENGATYRHYWRQEALARAARECARRRLRGVREDTEFCIKTALEQYSRKLTSSDRRHLVAKANLSWGVTYYTLGDKSNARRRIVDSLKQRPLQPRAAAFLVLTVLPHRVGAWARSVVSRKRVRTAVTVDE